MLGWRDWRGGRVVECTGFENQQGRKLLVGSNPTLSAKQILSRLDLLSGRGSIPVPFRQLAGQVVRTFRRSSDAILSGKEAIEVAFKLAYLFSHNLNTVVDV